MVQAFVFDCFGVIFAPSLLGWYADKSKELGYVDEQLEGVLHKFDLGEFSEKDLEDHFLQYPGLNKSREELRQELDSYVHRDERLVAYIRYLREKGKKIALLTNVNHAFLERVLYPAYPDFENLFDSRIISSEVKMVKPDLAIFQYTLATLRIRPEEAIFIDDAEKNVIAARGVGMQGVVYTDYDTFVQYVENLLGVA